MIGVKVKRQGEIYLMEFLTYDDMIKHIREHRPSQFSFCYDGEKTTASKPIAVKRVAENE